jgi:hypothetical protein
MAGWKKDERRFLIIFPFLLMPQALAQYYLVVNILHPHAVASLIY